MATINITVRGPPRIGKTALIRSFFQANQAFFPNAEPYPGFISSRLTFRLDGVHNVTLNIREGGGLVWAQGVLLLFDPFGSDNPHEIVAQLRVEIAAIREVRPFAVILLAGAKVDEIAAGDYIAERIVQFADHLGLHPHYFATSADNMINIREPFEELARGVFQAYGNLLLF